MIQTSVTQEIENRATKAWLLLPMKIYHELNSTL